MAFSLLNPAALVEGGFITNKVDMMKLATTEYRQQIALAIAEGVRRYGEMNENKSTLAVATARSE